MLNEKDVIDAANFWAEESVKEGIAFKAFGEFREYWSAREHSKAARAQFVAALHTVITDCAKALASKGGQAKSEAKTKAARANAKLPRKRKTVE